MHIGIHYRKGSFSDRWIEYCEMNEITHSVLDCMDNDIIDQLSNGHITHLMWHINHATVSERQYSQYVLNSADMMGIRTFPNSATRWHFDDKIAQKYLLEAINAPFIKSYVFYRRERAMEFLEQARFPIVGKLKAGAGSSNVQLIADLEMAKTYVERLFGKGIKSIPAPMDNLSGKIRMAKQIKNPLILVKKILSSLTRQLRERDLVLPEKGYVYFQEFLKNNDFDTRIITVGDKAFGIRRFNRKNDFRASGSGKIDYDELAIDKKMVSTALEVSKGLEASCLAYDFVYDAEGCPKIIEVCFGFSMLAYDYCTGYWDSQMEFRKGAFNPQFMMIEQFIDG